MLGRRCRQWNNIDPTLVEDYSLPGRWIFDNFRKVVRPNFANINPYLANLEFTMQARVIAPMPGQCWAGDVDGGPTLSH